MLNKLKNFIENRKKQFIRETVIDDSKEADPDDAYSAEQAEKIDKIIKEEIRKMRDGINSKQ